MPWTGLSPRFLLLTGVAIILHGTLGQPLKQLSAGHIKSRPLISPEESQIQPEIPAVQKSTVWQNQDGLVQSFGKVPASVDGFQHLAIASNEMIATLTKRKRARDAHHEVRDPA